ncbi:MAG TPA: tryptophan-rich sensory protein [Firmicutes bacterium]|nr:tryptophan-rich sensory protein [Bacillota bacterium]
MKKTTRRASGSKEGTAAKLQIPYLLWCYFAAYLSFATAALNS